MALALTNIGKGHRLQTDLRLAPLASAPAPGAASRWSSADPPGTPLAADSGVGLTLGAARRALFTLLAGGGSGTVLRRWLVLGRPLSAEVEHTGCHTALVHAAVGTGLGWSPMASDATAPARPARGGVAQERQVRTHTDASVTSPPAAEASAARAPPASGLGDDERAAVAAGSVHLEH